MEEEYNARFIPPLLDKQISRSDGVKQQGTNKLFFVCPLIIRLLSNLCQSIFVLVEEEVLFGGVVGPDVLDGFVGVAFVLDFL